MLSARIGFTKNLLSKVFNEKSKKQAIPTTSIIVVLWVGVTMCLLVLQAFNLHYGFRVWPMGEDRNWLRFMLDAPGLGLVRQFWLTNDRNPLSPWWYLIFSPLIPSPYP